MAEALIIQENASKADKYQSLISQINSVIDGEENLIANLANIAAMLHETFDNLWTGFYLADGNTLVLGPFQGPLACTRIPVEPIARGVCGVSAKEQKTLIVPDVDKFEGHIACSSSSRSEIVVPLVSDEIQTELVLDIDSLELNTFDEVDQKYCEEIISLIKQKHF